jgi:hypothetical protein
MALDILWHFVDITKVWSPAGSVFGPFMIEELSLGRVQTGPVKSKVSLKLFVESFELSSDL